VTATISRTRPLTLASRGSALAMAQTRQIGARLEQVLGISVSVLEVVSHGDVDERELTQIGGTGVFVSALRSALRDHTADLAVHSFKDLPTASEPDLVVAAVPLREDPSDVLVATGSASLQSLPPDARVGTGSPRRAAQLRALRQDLEIVDVRGNVDTRIAKVRSGALDAVVLARAGLARLGRLDEISYTFAPSEMLPAPGQGALAIECRLVDKDLAQRLGDALNDGPTRVCVEAERTVLAVLEAGCSAPVGALAEFAGDTLTLTAGIGESLRHGASVVVGPGGSGRELGEQVASELLRRGARLLMTVQSLDGTEPDEYDPGRIRAGHSMETD
jgi:hydroxymethylbilane synthase